MKGQTPASDSGGNSGTYSDGSPDSGDASNNGGLASSEDGVSEGSAILDEANNAISDDDRVPSSRHRTNQAILSISRNPTE